MELMSKVLAIVDIYFDCLVVILDIVGAFKVFIVDFGVSDQNVCEVFFGNV